MAQSLLTKAGKQLFEKHLDQYSPPDPLYEEYVDKKGRKKRRRRELPPGLSARDAKILKKVKSRAHYLDKGFRICGMRFGWTFIIGIVPGVGDVADAVLNYTLVVRKARQAEIPAWLLRQMLMNNTVSIATGLVPIAGDLVLAYWKANSRNAALLEEYLRIRGEEFLKLKAAGQDVVGSSVVGKKGIKDGKAKSGITEGDVDDLKPGAGRDLGEVVSGEKKGMFSGWKKGSVAPAATNGRFVEDVNGGSGSGSSGRR